MLQATLKPMRTFLTVSLLLTLISISFGSTCNRASWHFHGLLLLSVTISFFLPLLLATWLVPGGFAWHKYSSGETLVAPGPSGWPFLGSLPVFMSPVAHRRLAVLSKAHRASDLMVLSVGATPMVVSSDPETAREILHGPAFCDRPAKLSARLLMFENAIGFATAGSYWRHLRRVAAANLFCPRRIGALSFLRHGVVDDMLVMVGKAMEDKGLVALRGLLQRGSLENMVGSIFGRESLGEMEREELTEMVREGYELLGEFNLEDYFPCGGLLDHVVHGMGRRCKNLARRTEGLIGKVLEERRKQLGDLRRCMQLDFLSALLCLPKEERLSDSDMIAVLWEMTLRGTDVVAILLEWTMARMVLHPGVQADVQRELDAVVGARPVEDSDVPNLPYLRAVVKEALRMHPPGPLLSWARLATADVRVGKYFVPAGTTAVVNMWAIAHDEANWREPWEFRPERFVGDDDVNVLGSDLRLAPFGSGRRVCPGRALGLSVVHLWLASLLQRYRWTAAPGRPVDLSERLRLSLEMKEPLVCRAVRRARSPVVSEVQVKWNDACL